jgi:hypothetical protein
VVVSKNPKLISGSSAGSLSLHRPLLFRSTHEWLGGAACAGNAASDDANSNVATAAQRRTRVIITQTPPSIYPEKGQFPRGQRIGAVMREGEQRPNER